MLRKKLRVVALALLACFGAINTGFPETTETLLIGPGDTVHVQILDTPEMEQHPRVTDAGDIPLIGVGDLKVGGLTPSQAAARIRDALVSRHYMNHPDVTVTVEQYATQTVSVLGQVKAPGTYPISTPRSILSVIALAGGVTESADHHLMIQRRDSAQQPVSYDLSNDARAAISDSVEVYPGDTVIVPKAGIAYVLGDVGRPGGFLMQNNHSQLTVMQAVALAGGTLPSAVPSHARLIRKSPTGGFQEIALNFSAMQKGKQQDVELQPDDVLYVPFSYLRNVASSASGIVASTTSAALYMVP